MNYLRKKLQAIMASADFKGYLREVTGTDSVTLTDCMGSDMTSLSLVGNAIQDGTPSPDAPVEVQGCGERTRNLFDVSNFTSSPGGYVENGSIYVMSYPYQPGITPEDFLEMTGLKEGDTFTSVADYTQVLSPGVLQATSIQFLLKPSAPEDISTIVVFGNEGRLNTTTIPTGFNSDNFYPMYIYGGTSTGEGVRAIWSNLAIYKGSYTAETMPPYEPYGYKIPVEVSGINLFDVSQITDTSYITRDGDKLILNNYACSSQLSPEDFLEMTGLQPGDTITTTRDVSVSKGVANSITGRIAFLGKSGRAGYMLSDGSALGASVIPDDFDSEHYTSAHFYGASTPDENGDRIAEMSNIMIVKGSYTAATIPPYEPYHAPQTFNVYMDKPLYGLKLATGATGYYTYQDDNGNKYLCDTIAIDFDKHTTKRTDNLKYRSLADVAVWSEYTYILYDDVYSMFTLNGVNPGQDIKTYYTDTDGTNKNWTKTAIVSNAMPTDNTYPVNTTPSVCTGANPNDFADCIRYWFLKTDVDAYTGDTVKDRVAAYWEDFCADRDVMALYITNPSTTDISAMQDWDTIPKLWRGTAIATVKTTVPTKAITARYYATKKED